MGEIWDFVKKSKGLIVFFALAVVIFVSVSTVVSLKNSQIEYLLNEADRLSMGYYYKEAISLIEESGVKDKKLDGKINELNELNKTIKEYSGKIYHVFFHSLIAYPELAFDGDYKEEGYNMWMTTTSEFKAMLPEFYERGFILYPLNEIKDANPIMVPEGKKPLIISVDDVNYYGYMKGDGFADRLVVDEKVRVATYMIKPDGTREVTYDGDVFPILDDFVSKHPDFSYHGAKGIAAVTGYEGVFGYNFIKEEDKYKRQKLIIEATTVASALKKNGWLIACHSYTHNDYFRDGSVSMEDLQYDTNRFNERIYEAVLKPDIYISPFGYHLKEGDERLYYLKSMGYDYFCPVSPMMRTIYTKEGVVISERFNLDRYNMRTKKEYITKTFFDVDKVYYNK